MMKTTKRTTIFMIVLLSILCIILLGFMIAVMCGVLPIWKFNFQQSKTSSRLAYEEVFDGEFQKIDIDLSYGDIQVMPSEDEFVHVAIYSEKDLFDVNDTSTFLSIQFREEEGFHFSFSREKDLVLLYLPLDYDNLVSLFVDGGDVLVSDFLNASFDITMNMGDATIGKINTLSIDSDMGNISIDTVARLTVSQDMGDIEIDSITEEVSIKNDMGNVDILNLSLKKDSKIELSLGDVQIDHVDNVYIDASVDLGDIDITKNNRKASYTLTIENDMGDITVE